MHEEHCLSWPSSAWATQPLDCFSATDQSFVQRSLPFVTLLSGVTKSVGDEECFGDIVVGVAAVCICKELAARCDDRVLKQSGSTERCSIILESRPRLSLSHAREQRVHAYARMTKSSAPRCLMIRTLAHETRRATN